MYRGTYCTTYIIYRNLVKAWEILLSTQPDLALHKHHISVFRIRVFFWILIGLFFLSPDPNRQKIRIEPGSIKRLKTESTSNICFIIIFSRTLSKLYRYLFGSGSFKAVLLIQIHWYGSGSTTLLQSQIKEHNLDPVSLSKYLYKGKSIKLGLKISRSVLIFVCTFRVN